MSEDSATASLRSRVLRGAAWTTSASFGMQVSRLVFGVVLARLLTPDEYGIAAMALVFAALVLGISDFGLGAGLVQRPRITEEDRSTVFWTSVGIGVLLMAIGLALSKPVAAFFGEPEVRPLFAVVSVGFLLTALGRAHAALLQREMAFRAIAVRLMAATVVGGIVGVALAALGYGPWALVGLHMTNGLVTTLLLWISSPWRPRLVFSRRSLRELGGFGLNVFGSKFCDYLHGNTDKVLVGRVLGSSALGFYNVAYNLVVLPFVSLLVALTDALFPAMSRVQTDPRRVAAAWLRGTRALVAVAAPAMLGLVVVAPDFVSVVLGEKWRPATPVVQLLALAMVVHATAALGTTVLTAVDRTRTLLRFSISEVAIILVALAIGLRWGIIGVAVAYLAAITCTRSVLSWLAARTLAVSMPALVTSIAGVLQAALAMMLVAWAVRLALLETGVPAAVRLVAAVVIGVLVYLPLCVWRSPDVVREVRTIRSAGAPG